MARTRNTPRSAQRTASNSAPLELPPDRAFVLRLDAHARPSERLVGRIEHVTSGKVAHVTSLRELVAFLTDVLRDQAPGD
ncbi:MAG: hypothetical protein DMF95_31175 [Acidobacteria bacterium]|nr:MAG: hypothetical protein DMF95_31175 [Acidobacteriota bacterium]